jgi:hypothetical protein
MGTSKRTQKRRVYLGRGPRPDRTEKKRAEALGRNEAFQELSVERRLASLPIGGAKKQRAKLEALLEEERSGKPRQRKYEPLTKENDQCLPVE